MTGKQDVLLTFRTVSGEWADLARAEARAVRSALAERSGSAVAAAHRLSAIVEDIRAAGYRATNDLAALMDEQADGITPDEAKEINDLADDIVALNKEMSDLLRATLAAGKAALKCWWHLQARCRSGGE